MSARLLDRFDGRLRLEGQLVTHTGLHIGAGGSGDPLATDAPVVRDAAGRIFIPGSSLKGVVRSAAEALMKSAPTAEDGQKRLWSCDHLAGPKAQRQACVTHDQLKTLREQHEEDPQVVAETVWEKSCTVCRLFGSLALASRVRFPDLLLAGEVAGTELRNGVGIDRDRELAADGVLYDFEAVPPDTTFDLAVILDNVDDFEIGLILYLFDELDRGSLSLGGKTSRGLGQVHISWDRMLETTLAHGNPFASMLSSRDLLAPAEDKVAEQAQEDGEPPLPTTGKPAAWQTLAQIMRALPIVEKGDLGQKAAEHGLRRQTLNKRLGLGLEDKAAGKPWDAVLGALVETGWLVPNDDHHLVWDQVPEPAPKDEAEIAAEAAAAQARRLQDQIDRYVGAMAQRWQEAA